MLYIRSTIVFCSSLFGRPSMHGWYEYGERPSDEPADALLVNLSKAMKNENPEFEFDETQRLFKGI